MLQSPALFKTTSGLLTRLETQVKLEEVEKAWEEFEFKFKFKFRRRRLGVRDDDEQTTRQFVVSQELSNSVIDTVYLLLSLQSFHLSEHQSFVTSNDEHRRPVSTPSLEIIGAPRHDFVRPDDDHTQVSESAAAAPAATR